MFSQWRRRRAARRVTAGDGHPLRRFRWWQLFSRALFHIRLPDEQGREVLWSVDVSLWGEGDDGETYAKLYRDRVHHAQSKVPAFLPVPGGTIEVETSSFGLRRCHVVGDDGQERQLWPDPASAEGRRLRLERRHPAGSRMLGIVSLVAVAAGVVLGVPQIVEQLSQIPPIADNLGTFTSPFQLSAAVNIVVLVATIAGSTERALRLRYHWLLDGGLYGPE